MNKRQLSAVKEIGKLANAQRDQNDLPTFHINLWISGNCRWTNRPEKWRKATRLGRLHWQRDGIEYNLGNQIILKFCSGKRDPISNTIWETELYCDFAIAKTDFGEGWQWPKRHENEYNSGNRIVFCVAVAKRDLASNIIWETKLYCGFALAKETRNRI